MRKINPTYILISILILTIIFLVSILLGNGSESKGPRLISNLVRENAVIGGGFDFDSGEFIALNPLTGRKIPPCSNTSKSSKEINSDIKSYTVKDSETITKPETNTDLDCSVEILNPNKNLQAALEASKSIIKGKVIENGKEISAIFTTLVIASYTGSFCQVTWVAGKKYKQCLNENTACTSIKNHLQNILPNPSKQNIFNNLPPTCKKLFPL